LGNGSQRCGGAASTTDGNSFAFGNTLEWLFAVVLGKKARGTPTDPPLDRRTGLGRVDATPGHYRDALAKGPATSCTCSPPSPPVPSRAL